MKIILHFSWALVWSALSNPYPDPNLVPQDPLGLYPERILHPAASGQPQGLDIVRVDVEWILASDTYQIVKTSIEKSGTEALFRRARKMDSYGSYRAQLGSFHDSVGTGQEFRRLTRAMTFRFPIPASNSEFVLTAENPETGIAEEVLRHVIDSARLVRSGTRNVDLEVRLIKEASVKPALIVNVYSEGYQPPRKNQFWIDAGKVASAFEKEHFPMLSRMEIWAVWSPSQEKLGAAENLGLPVPERNSFLGLYFPYWNPFGRWYHVIYPTREIRYRSAAGQVSYDYPIALVDDSQYWGVGNFNELTAVPSSNGSFTYLLLHEFGHYFGLNEEYEGGGPTELAFAPQVSEPWSQNITFLKDPSQLKWKNLISSETPIPTSDLLWTGDGPYGAYRGGYADTPPLNHSHKPGFTCVMKNGKKFCPICVHAIESKVKFDLGE